MKIKHYFTLAPWMIAMFHCAPIFAQTAPGSVQLKISQASTNGLQIDWNTQSGKIYNLQRATNVLGTWRSLAGLRTASSVLLSAEDPLPPPQSFYRVISVEKIVSVVETNDGGTVKLGLGDILEITLAANPSTGFLWEVSPAPVNVNQVAAPTHIPGIGIGASGKTVFQFEPTAGGESTLQLIYHRTFDKNTPPEKTFTLTVSTLP